MSRFKRKPLKRRVMTNEEIAEYIGLHPQTITNYLNDYRESGNSYDAKNPYDLLDFVLWLLRTGKTSYERQSYQADQRRKQSQDREGVKE